MTGDLIARLRAVGITDAAIPTVLEIIAEREAEARRPRTSTERSRAHRAKACNENVPSASLPRPEIVAPALQTPPEPRAPAFSIGEEVIIKEIPSVSRKTEPKPKRDPAEADATVEQFVDAYDRLASSVALPRCRVITDKRKSHVLARCRDLVSHFDYPSLQAGIDGFFNKVRGSPFLCGAGNGRKWKADLDWLINESNFVKVLEGYYEKAPGANGHNVFAFGR